MGLLITDDVVMVNIDVFNVVFVTVAMMGIDILTVTVIHSDHVSQSVTVAMLDIAVFKDI